MDIEGMFPHSVNCKSCIVGKGTQLSFPDPCGRALQPGEILHIDACVDFPTPTPQSHQHVLSILDNATNFSFVYLMKKKSEALGCYKDAE